jgi:anti-sigma B factor antagonist
MTMHYQLQEEGDITVVSLSGSVDVNSALELRNVVQGLLKAGANILVDLSETKFIDSSGLSVFTKAYQISQDVGAQITLVSPQPPVRKVFKLTGFEKVFNIVDSLEEGRSSFE